MRVAIQGEPGSNSHLAVTALLGPQILAPCALSAEVFEQLARQHADAAVLPIENSLHGAVADHYDLLLEHDIAIVGETALRIRHALIAAPGVSLASVRRVFSHSVALSQCRRFFLEHPDLQAVPFYDTAGAVKHVVAGGDPSTAAIAAPSAASVYGGAILQRDLEDDPQNFTRFFLLARVADAERIRTAAGLQGSADKLTVAFAVPHRPGSLVHVLQGLALAGADLTRIESRPVPGKPWEYIFFVDLRVPGAPAGFQVTQWLQAECTLFRLLGRYGTTPTAEAPATPAASAGMRR